MKREAPVLVIIPVMGKRLPVPAIILVIQRVAVFAIPDVMRIVVLAIIPAIHKK